LSLPLDSLATLIDISIFTAKFATFVLWYTGFAVSRQGFHISLPEGGVEVYPGCSGLENIIHLLKLTLLFLVIFPPNKWINKILVPLVAIFIAFVVNGVRVALLAVLVASSKQQAFDYWHLGEGSLIFSMFSVFIFGLFCLFLLQQEKAENQDTEES